MGPAKRIELPTDDYKTPILPLNYTGIFGAGKGTRTPNACLEDKSAKPLHYTHIYQFTRLYLILEQSDSFKNIAVSELSFDYNSIISEFKDSVKNFFKNILVRPVGLEPTTHGLKARYSAI